MIFARFYIHMCVCVCVCLNLCAILTAVTQEKILQSKIKFFASDECNISCWTSWGTIRTIYGLLMDFRSFENVNHGGGSQRHCHASCLSKNVAERFIFSLIMLSFIRPPSVAYSDKTYRKIFPGILINRPAWLWYYLRKQKNTVRALIYGIIYITIIYMLRFTVKIILTKQLGYYPTDFIKFYKKVQFVNIN